MLKLYILLAALHSINLTAFKHRVPIRPLVHNSFSLFGTMTHGVKKENLPTKVCVTCNRPFTWRKKWERCWDEVTTCSKGCNAKRRTAKKEGGVLDDDSDDEKEEDEENSKNSVQKKGGGHLKSETKAEIKEGGDDGVSRKELKDKEKKKNDSDDDRNTTLIHQEKTDKKEEKEDEENEEIADENKEDNDDDTDDEEKEIIPQKQLSRKKLKKLKMKEIEAFEASKVITEELGEESDLKNIPQDDPKNVPKNVPKNERTKTCAVCKGEDVLLFRCQWDASKQWRFVCKPCWPSISGAASSKKAAQDAEGNYKSPNPLYNYGGTWKGRGRAP